MEHTILGIKAVRLFRIAVFLQVSVNVLALLHLLPFIPWASQGSGSDHWEGNLCSVVDGKHNGKSYDYLRSKYDRDGNYESDYEHGQYTTFLNLTFGCYFYYILESLACVMMLISTLSLFMVKQYRYSILFIIVMAILQSIAHAFAVGIWFLINPYTMSGECSKTYSEDTDFNGADICVEAGGAISIVIMILIGLLAVGWCVLGTVYLIIFRRNFIGQHVNYSGLEL